MDRMRYVIWRAVHGAYDIGRFLLHHQCHHAGQLQPAAGFLHCLRNRRSGALPHDLIAFFDMKPAVYSKPDGLPAPVRSNVDLSSATSHLPIQDYARILQDFNFTIRPSERIALIAKMAREKPPSSS